MPTQSCDVTEDGDKSQEPSHLPNSSVIAVTNGRCCADNIYQLMEFKGAVHPKTSGEVFIVHRTVLKLHSKTALQHSPR